MVSPGTGDRHIQGAQRLGLHPGYDHNYPGDMQRRIKDRFRILLPVADTVQMFGEKMKLSHIATVPQAHRHPGLILNLSRKSEVGHPESTTPPTDRRLRSLCSLLGPSPAPSRWSVRQTRPRVQYGCLRLTSPMRTTEAPLCHCRLSQLCMSSHRPQGTRAASSESIWSYRWGGWTRPSFSAHFQKFSQM